MVLHHFSFIFLGSYKAKVSQKIYEDESVYEGMLRREMRYGQGIYYYQNGDIYLGEWVDDYFEG